MLHVGVINERNAFLRSILQAIASGDFIALAMTAQESHCESDVADAAVSVQITLPDFPILHPPSAMVIATSTLPTITIAKAHAPWPMSGMVSQPVTA